MTDKSIANVGDLAKPVTAIVERLADFTGGFLLPYQMRRIARAENDVALIHALGQEQLTDLQHRAVNRMAADAERTQHNIENVVEKAIPEISTEADASAVSQDWLSTFVDKAKNISDTDMQTLWARILAGEVNQPGSYSRRAVNVLDSLDQASAHSFVKLCGLSWTGIGPVIFDLSGAALRKIGWNYEQLLELEALGLISFSSGSFATSLVERNFYAAYFDRVVTIKCLGDLFEYGRVMLTPVGQQLANLVKAEPLEGAFDRVVSVWRGKGYEVVEVANVVVQVS